MNTNYHDIIAQLFNKNFFLGNESSSTVKNIQSNINAFNQQFPNLENYFLDSLKSSFSDALIENHTQFFNNDRCIRFLVQLADYERYVVQISVFKLFSIYKHPFAMVNSKYIYEDITFINNQELDVADLIHSCLPTDCKHFDWLNKDILNQIVPAFSVIEKDEKLSHIVKIADVLFTSHYI
jgi:hypothetical protein